MLTMITMLGQPMSLILLISVTFSLLIHLSVYEKGGWVGSDPWGREPVPATCQDLDLHGALITHRVVFLSHPPLLITESALDIPNTAT